MVEGSEEEFPRMTQEEWRTQVYEPARARFGERREEFRTPSELLLEPCYGEGEGMPGVPPYTRGVQPTMYRSRFWTMRQYSGFGSARETNKRFRYLLEQGQSGLSVAFDLPTQMGYDSDHPLALPEVGKVGVPINSLLDMERLLDGIPLDKVSTSMTINATAPILLALYLAVAKKRGIPMDKVSGTIQNDILKEYAARGTYRFPVQGSMRLITDVFAFATENVPKWNTISISGYHIREAGSTAVQELAFTLANGLAYVEAARARGLDPNVFGRRLSFFFNAHNDFFEEIAKFRAARRMWARFMRERFGVTDKKALMLRFHTQTAGSTLTSQQPLNNVARVTVQALSAVLGGTQSLHTNAMDEALGLPTELSARTALRTQQILAYESGVADVVDPLGGSPFVEALTDAVEEGAQALIQKIDELGGAVAAIEAGFYQEEIHRSAMRWQREVEQGERVIVGLNRFEVEEEEVEVFRVDDSLREETLEDLEECRRRRDPQAVAAALDRIQEVARGDENLMPHILHAVGVLATVGEICDRLERVFGKYLPGSAF
ncbi:MAG TPA: methylmalonyl-CoA mutase [Planctomycetes bacterium]|nr:methylmalonyl-CoA mutase [Planctomycetota bacterium]